MLFVPLATSSAPWWGAPVIASVAALSGVLLTLLGTQWRASLDLRHKDRARWDDLILDTATRLLALTGELAETGRVGYPRYVEDVNERMVSHLRITGEVNEAIARFGLVASDRLRAAAVALYGAAMFEEIEGPVSPDENRQTYDDARASFVFEVREEVRANRD